MKQVSNAIAVLEPKFPTLSFSDFLGLLCFQPILTLPCIMAFRLVIPVDKFVLIEAEANPHGTHLQYFG